MKIQKTGNIHSIGKYTEDRNYPLYRYCVYTEDRELWSPDRNCIHTTGKYSEDMELWSPDRNCIQTTGNVYRQGAVVTRQELYPHYK